MDEAGIGRRLDDNLAAGEAASPLTTMAQPIREKGRRAAELVFAPGPPRHELLDVALVARRSTGRAPV
jgi:DNA-binding LacI/PurR family transcriptional regulator